jgi:formate dehydrogenase alpha subunit
MISDLHYEPTICPYCTSGCGIYLVLKDGEIVGEEPRKNYPLNEGKNCIKGNNAYKFLSHPDRLKTPLIQGRASSWDEAISLIAERFKGVSPEGFGVLGSGKTSNEESYLLQKFTRVVMHTNNVEYCARFCHSATVAGLGPTLGSGVMQTSQLDLDQADCILVAGVNLSENFSGIARRIKRAREKGTKVIVMDPRITMTVKSLADMHLQLRPGTDAAALNAMIKIILDEGLQNDEFISTRTVGFEQLKTSVEDLDLEECEKITGVTLKQMRQAALSYAKAHRGCILFDEGITQHISGSDNIKLLADLALLTGHIGKPGTGANPMRGQISGEGSGDMGCVNVFYPGFKLVSPEAAEQFQELWGVEALPSKPGKSYMDIINTCKAVYVVGVNPMISAPDSSSVRKALEGLDFLVVQDIFMTETAELADVVLPAAAWVEREGTHTGVDRRVEKINRIVDPPGEAKPDWWIITKLAHEMGHSREFCYTSAGEIFEEIRRCVPQYAGITYERLDQTVGGIHWPCPSEEHPGTPTMFAERFNTPDGKGHFVPAEFKPPAELPDEQYPYVLTTGRVIFHYHTASMTKRTDSLASELAEGFVQINPSDAAELEIKDGERVVVRSRRGKIEVRARVSGDIPSGVAFVPFHFAGTRANALTNPAFDPACKMPEFKVCAIDIEKAGNEK